MVRTDEFVTTRLSPENTSSKSDKMRRKVQITVLHKWIQKHHRIVESECYFFRTAAARCISNCPSLRRILFAKTFPFDLRVIAVK
jgi:hypothetical protein